MYRALLTLPDIRYHCERSTDTIPSPDMHAPSSYDTKALRRSHGDDDDAIKDIVKSTAAVFFLGTPHRGSAYAPLGQTFRRIASAVGFDSNDSNLRTLHFDSIVLELSREEFIKIWRTYSLEVRTFQESQGLVGVKGLSGKVFPRFD
jgi:hypothetical protein